MTDDYYRHGELARAEARIAELEAEVDRLNTELARARAEVVARRVNRRWHREDWLERRTKHIRPERDR